MEIAHGQSIAPTRALSLTLALGLRVLQTPLDV